MNTTDRIIEHLNGGGVVVVSNHMKSTQYDKRHVTMFRQFAGQPHVQRGKHWDCIKYCKITLRRDLYVGN